MKFGSCGRRDYEMDGSAFFDRGSSLLRCTIRVLCLFSALITVEFSFFSCSPSSISATNCNSDTCDGCCDNNKCVKGKNDVACGKEGNICSDCTKDTKTCVNQACKASTNACGTCTTGCCSGQTCVTQLSDTLCGTGGVLCEDCTTKYTPARKCSSGICSTVSGDSTYQVQVTNRDDDILAVSFHTDLDPADSWVNTFNATAGTASQSLTVATSAGSRKVTIRWTDPDLAQCGAAAYPLQLEQTITVTAGSLATAQFTIPASTSYTVKVNNLYTFDTDVVFRAEPYLPNAIIGMPTTFPCGMPCKTAKWTISNPMPLVEGMYIVKIRYNNSTNLLETTSQPKEVVLNQENVFEFSIKD
jgi:hypothetical protein